MAPRIVPDRICRIQSEISEYDSLRHVAYFCDYFLALDYLLLSCSTVDDFWRFESNLRKPTAIRQVRTKRLAIIGFSANKCVWDLKGYIWSRIRFINPRISRTDSCSSATSGQRTAPSSCSCRSLMRPIRVQQSWWLSTMINDDRPCHLCIGCKTMNLCFAPDYIIEIWNAWKVVHK